MRAALDELVEYLCDRSVPLTVTDSIELLLDQPPELTAEVLGLWVAAQRDAGSATRVSDYLHHAVKKIAMMAEFSLIDMDRLGPFLVALSQALLAYCPAQEHELFVTGLRSIGRPDTRARGAVSVLYRPPESMAAGAPGAPAATGVPPVPGVPGVPPVAVPGVPPGAAVAPVHAAATSAPGAAPAASTGPSAVALADSASSAVFASSLNRFSLLLERLTLYQSVVAPGALGSDAAPPGVLVTRAPAAGMAVTAVPVTAVPVTGAPVAGAPMAGAPVTRTAAAEAILAEALKSAALEARDAGEFDAALRQLAGLGVDASMEQVVRGIARSLPQWLVAADDAADDVRWQDNRSMGALHRIVATAPDPTEAARRFFGVLTEAVDLFNQGDLGRALAAAHVVRRLMREREVAPSSSDLMLRRAAATVSGERLNALAADPAKRPHVRRFLDLFPDLWPPALLARLADEPDRQRRKVLLSMVEAWGSRARPAIVASMLDIQRGEAPDPHGYIERNLVYLLRRIPPPPEGWREDEIEMLGLASGPTRPLIVLREAIRALGKVQNDQATKILLQRLGQIERILVERPGDLPFSPEDGITILDRTIEALALQAQPVAIRAIENHSRRKEAALGACLPRIEVLQTIDLSGNPAVIERILERIRADLPSRLTALALGSRSERITPLVVALSSTRTRAVLESMGQLAQKFPQEPYGMAAQAILDQRPVPAAHAAAAGSGLGSGPGAGAGAGPGAGPGPGPGAGAEDDLTGPLAPTGPVGSASSPATPEGSPGRIAAGPAATDAAPKAPAATDAAATDAAAADAAAADAAATAGAQRAISGALDIFGLPSLLQNLALSKLSGSLVLSDAAGEAYARIVLDRGALEGCTIGHLEGEAAFHQVFAAALGGSFEFTSTGEPNRSLEGAGPDVTGIIFESLRRVDELQLLRALVPDTARLVPTGTRPTVVPEEQDTALQRQTWGIAITGRSVTEIEAALPVDSYRARRMLAHWVEKRALTIQ